MYILKNKDKPIINAAIVLLEKIQKAPFITPAKLITVCKLLHVLMNLPKATDISFASVSLSGPRRWYGDHEIWHWWQVQLDSGYLSVSSGGHFYRQSTGGDSFTYMQWTANPDSPSSYSDYSDTCRIVDDVQPFDVEVNQLDLQEQGYSLEIYDDDNPLLDEEESGDDTEEDDLDQGQEDQTDAEIADDNLAEEDDEEEYLSNFRCVSSTDAIENSLNETSNEAMGFAKKMFGHFEDTCSFCKTDLSSKKYFVDGKMKGSIMWGLMCARCFHLEGEGIGWGKGQLYTRLTNGKWLMTAGFPPEEHEGEEDRTV